MHLGVVPEHGFGEHGSTHSPPEHFFVSTQSLSLVQVVDLHTPLQLSQAYPLGQLVDEHRQFA